MKKKFVLFSVFFLLINLLSAQENYYLQYQDLYWRIVKNAKRYEVTIEKKDGESWIFEAQKEVPETNLQTYLFPGEYRYSVVPINAIGVRAAASEWKYFEVSDENDPIFYDRSFSKVKEYDVPIINLKKNDELAYFTVYGKDIYFLDSAFSLVPIPMSDTYMGSYNSYIDERPVVKLQVLERNKDLNATVLAFEYKDVFSGYYDLHVKNPGGIEKSATILLKLDDPVVLDFAKEKYDSNYKIYTKSIVSNDKMLFTVRGKGFDSETSYTLKADKRKNQYPFTSDWQTNNAILTLANYHYESDTQNIRLDFLLNQASVSSGYYTFIAEKNGKKYEYPFLLKVKKYSYPEPLIKSIKLKSSKNKDVLVVEGENLPLNPTVKLVTEYIPEIGGNNRIFEDRILESYENSIQIEYPKDVIQEMKYALILESRDRVIRDCFEMKGGKPVRLFLREPEEIEEVFCGSIDKTVVEKVVKVEKTEKVEKSPAEKPKKVVYTKSKMYTQMFFPYAEFELGYNGLGELTQTNADVLDFSAGLNFCLMNFTLFKVDLPVTYTFNNLGHFSVDSLLDWKNNLNLGPELKLTLPLQVVFLDAPNITPYAGGSVIANISAWNNLFTYTKDYTKFNLFAGMEMFNIVDLKISLNAGSLTYLDFASGLKNIQISAGVIIPFSKTKQKKLER